MHALLAQAPPAPAAPGFDTIFWLTILTILVVTIAGALIRRLSKDKCLKFLNGYHVTVLWDKRPTLWGDMAVTSDGFELIFDAPQVSRRGVSKSGLLVYPDEFPACIAVARTLHGLTAQERAERERQVRRSFNPGRLRRAWRWARNLANTIRDAISRSIGLVVGRIGGAGAMGAVFRGQSADVAQLGGTVVTLGANAYEPLLERHIGRPVVVEIAGAQGADPPSTEWPGYLVDYTEKFIAVFNVNHEPEEAFDVDLGTPEAPLPPGIALERADGRVTVRCTGPEAVVLRNCQEDADVCQFAIALLPGTAVRLGPQAGPGRIRVERTRRLDLVCPRARARVRFAGESEPRAGRSWSGIAPDLGEVVLRATRRVRRAGRAARARRSTPQNPATRSPREDAQRQHGGQEPRGPQNGR